MLCQSNALIRPLRDSEIPLINKWAINEGWNPGLDDARIFNAVDPGSLMALEVNGVTVGAISAVRLTDTYGFAGLFVLSPSYRKSRFGWMLLQAGLTRMEDRVIGSETIFELVRTYARYGMKPYYTTVSYHGTAPLHPPAWRPGVELATASDADEMAAYDAESSGVQRGPFLRAWVQLPNSLVLVFKRQGRVCGMGMVRRCHHGVRIGPLQADDPAVAEALFDALSGFAPGEAISIDSSDINPDGPKLALAKGLVADSSTSRLYRGTPPVGRLQRVYGLISFSLG